MYLHIVFSKEWSYGCALTGVTAIFLTLDWIKKKYENNPYRLVCWDVNSSGGMIDCVWSFVSTLILSESPCYNRLLWHYDNQAWWMDCCVWHKSEINKTMTTSDGKTDANFLATGKLSSPKLLWAWADTSIRGGCYDNGDESRANLYSQVNPQMNGTMTSTFWSKVIITACTMKILTRNKKIVHKFLSFCSTYFESLLDCSRLPQICYIFIIMCN